MASYIRRRKFLALLGGASAAWPLSAHAQQRKVSSIGALVIGNISPEEFWERSQTEKECPSIGPFTATTTKPLSSWNLPVRLSMQVTSFACPPPFVVDTPALVIALLL